MADAPTPNLADALEFDATYWRDLHWIIELADRQDAAAAQLRQLDRIKAQLRQLDRIKAERDALLSSLDELWDWAIDACGQVTPWRFLMSDPSPDTPNAYAPRCGHHGNPLVWLDPALRWRCPHCFPELFPAARPAAGSSSPDVTALADDDRFAP